MFHCFFQPNYKVVDCFPPPPLPVIYREEILPFFWHIFAYFKVLIECLYTLRIVSFVPMQCLGGYEIVFAIVRHPCAVAHARFCVSLVTPDATTKISNEAFQLSHFVAKPAMTVSCVEFERPIRSIQQPCSSDVEHGRQLLLFSARHCFLFSSTTYCRLSNDSEGLPLNCTSCSIYVGVAGQWTCSCSTVYVDNRSLGEPIEVVSAGQTP